MAETYEGISETRDALSAAITERAEASKLALEAEAALKAIDGKITQCHAEAELAVAGKSARSFQTVAKALEKLSVERKSAELLLSLRLKRSLELEDAVDTAKRKHQEEINQAWQAEYESAKAALLEAMEPHWSRYCRSLFATRWNQPTGRAWDDAGSLVQEDNELFAGWHRASQFDFQAPWDSEPAPIEPDNVSQA
jgi:hypothetical protein